MRLHLALECEQATRRDRGPLGSPAIVRHEHQRLDVVVGREGAAAVRVPVAIAEPDEGGGELLAQRLGPLARLGQVELLDLPHLLVRGGTVRVVGKRIDEQGFGGGMERRLLERSDLRHGDRGQRPGAPHHERGGRSKGEADGEPAPATSRRRRWRERIEDLVHRRRPRVRVAPKRSPQHVVHPASDAGLRDFDERVGGPMTLERVDVVAGKRCLPVQRFPQRDGEGVDVGPHVGGVTPQLLGGHVPRGSGERGCGGSRIVRREQAGQAEVADFDCAVGGAQHVAGLEVVVHQSRVVDRSEPTTRRAECLDDLGLRSLRVVQPRPQRRSLDQLHGDVRRRWGVGTCAIRAHVVHRHDVRAGQLREGLGLPQRVGPRVGPRERGLEQLQCETPVELGVERRVHRPHAPAAEAVQDDVSPQLGTARQRARRSPLADRIGRTSARSERRLLEHASTLAAQRRVRRPAVQPRR